jgi:hypothetical protein
MANHCCVRGLYHFDIHWDKTNFSVIHGRCASDIIGMENWLVDSRR